VHISTNSCTQTDGHIDTQMDKLTNLIISSNSLRSIGRDKKSTLVFLFTQKANRQVDEQAKTENVVH